MDWEMLAIAIGWREKAQELWFQFKAWLFPAYMRRKAYEEAMRRLFEE